MREECCRLKNDKLVQGMHTGYCEGWPTVKITPSLRNKNPRAWADHQTEKERHTAWITTIIPKTKQTNKLKYLVTAYTSTPTCSRQSFFCASYSNIVTHAMFLPNLINKVAIDTKRIRFDYKMHNQPAVKEKRENLLRNKKNPSVWCRIKSDS